MAARMVPCNVLLLFILVALTFSVANPNQINVASFNMHGFSTSSSYLKNSISLHEGIWLIQEHWLSERQLEKLHDLNTQFVARSGMEESLASGIYRGRPFGGVAPALNHCIKPVTNYKHKRVVAIETKCQDKDILIICVYMPFFSSSKKEQCMTEATDAISMVELLIEGHPNHQVIIGGDLNTELKGSSPFDPLWLELISKYQLAYCSDQFNGPGYTYRHDTLNQTKFNDHFLVHKSFINDQVISNFRILDEGDNTSDHLPIVMCASLHVQTISSNTEEMSNPECINWKKMSPSDLAAYETELERLLLRRTHMRAVSSCTATCACSRESCLQDIQDEYDEIISCMVQASKVLPKRSKGIEKDWWTAELSQLRDQSISIQSLWVSEGQPRHGPTYHERLRIRAAYKSALRKAKKAPKQKAWNRLHSAMADEDNDSFWKWWRTIYSKKSNHVPPVVDGQSSKAGIANSFRKSFELNSKPNNPKKVAEIDAHFCTKYNDMVNSHNATCNCSQYKVTLEETYDAICQMKRGKCSDDDGLSAEHFLNAPLILIIKLSALFNYMLVHAFVPRQFRFGTIVPIVKDKQGNLSDVSNYRGITISPMVTKVFERVLNSLFSSYLSTSSYQFGFKRKNSTSHALYCLRETINHYIDHGSKVYCSFLDASKAFDRLVHSGLFLKLIEKNVPKLFIDILICWYSGLQCRVRWDGFCGEWFPISAGVRQGGILSPTLYNIYVDELISILQKANVGCHIATYFAACLFYADDMCILAPSLKGLQTMLDICGEYCAKWDICLNSKKTKNMAFGKKTNPEFKLHLNGSHIDWVDSWKYLGVVLKAGTRFGCSIADRVKSFYRSLNSILRVEGRSDDMILLKLIETHCVPILCYAIEIIHVADRDERRSLRVAYNSIFRKLFGYKTFESVTNLQHALKRYTWEELVESRRAGFMIRAKSSHSSSLVRAFC